MATVFYYDASGVKKQTDSSQLQTLVKFGVIKPDSIIENEKGARVQASRINGLNFNATISRVGGSSASTSSTASTAVPPASLDASASSFSASGSVATPPPNFETPRSGASSSFDGAFHSGQSSTQTPGGGVGSTGSSFSSAFDGGQGGGESRHCTACGALLTGAGRFCPRCGVPSADVIVGYCPACGAQIYAGQSTCTNCGCSTNAIAGVSNWFNKTFGANGAPHPNQSEFTGTGSGATPGAKSKTTAGILALLLGGLGIHKFYLGSWGWGILYIVFCWTYIPSILGLIEGIMYLTTDDVVFQNKYSPMTQSAFRW